MRRHLVVHFHGTNPRRRHSLAVFSCSMLLLACGSPQPTPAEQSRANDGTSHQEATPSEAHPSEGTPAAEETAAEETATEETAAEEPATEETAAEETAAEETAAEETAAEETAVDSANRLVVYLAVRAPYEANRTRILSHLERQGHPGEVETDEEVILIIERSAFESLFRARIGETRTGASSSDRIITVQTLERYTVPRAIRRQVESVYFDHQR